MEKFISIRGTADGEYHDDDNYGDDDDDFALMTNNSVIGNDRKRPLYWLAYMQAKMQRLAPFSTLGLFTSVNPVSYGLFMFI